MEDGKLKVLTTGGACKQLGVSRTTFEIKIKQRLTKLEKVGTRNFFLYDEVVRLKNEAGKIITPEYNVIA